MKHSKIFSTLCIVCAVALLGSGCGKKNQDEVTIDINSTGYPVAEQTINLTMMGIKSGIQCEWKDNLFFQEMEKLTNIHFTFNTTDSTVFDEKKNLAFASGELPDVFFKAQLKESEIANYGGQGILIPLEDLIDKYAPNLKALLEQNPDVKKAITCPDGHIYSLPAIQLKSKNFNQTVFNQKWMDKLGLSEPENVDDLYEILKAFKTQDPNGNGIQDEIPISFVGIDQLKASLLHGFGVICDSHNMFIDNGEAKFIPYTDEFVDAVKYFKKLYSEGLMDKDSFTQNSNQLSAKGKGEDELLGMFYTSGAFLYVGENRHFDYQSMIPLKTADGRQIYMGWEGIGIGAYSITNVCKYPEAAMRWVDYLYSEEGGKLVWCGVENETYKINEDGTWDWILEEGQEQNDLRGKATIQSGTNVPHLNPEDFFYKINNVYEQSLKPLRARIMPYVVQAVPTIYFDDADLKTVNSITADIDPYVNEMMTKFIIGTADIDAEMGAFRQKLKDMRADELVEIYQRTYDASAK